MSEMLTKVYEVRCRGDKVRRTFSLSGLSSAIMAAKTRRTIMARAYSDQQAPDAPAITIEDMPITITAYSIDLNKTEQWTVQEEDDG